MLRILLISSIIALLSMVLRGQDGYIMKANEEYVEIDLLSSYYQQDGNNAAVTGGIGTERLTDIATMIVVNVPLDSTHAINISAGADYYTSASTDNIDNNRSSASSKDIRAYASLGFNKKNLRKGISYGMRLGFSNEYDYSSFNGGLSFAKEFNEGNSELSVNAQAFIDQWRTYFPEELRRSVSVPTRSRNSYNGELTYSQVINKRLQIAISAEAVYMEGLLSTPFHRVYFANVQRPDIERLPSRRLKIPLSLRVNYFPMEAFVVRSYYRFYRDDFGVAAHTASIEVPVKLSSFLTLYPFFRYHTQTAADYFAPFALHTSDELFYTSDYDLSDLNSQKYGMGVEYAPLYGLARTKIPFSKKVFNLHSVGLRAARYVRSTGLRAYNFSFNLNMRI